MEQMHDRRQEILQFMEPYMETQFQESCRRIQAEIEKSGYAVWDALEEKINELLSGIADMQRQHKKGEIKYFAISFLRVSLHLERLEFYIQAMDRGFYLDGQKPGIYYCPQFLQEPYREDLDCLHQRAGDNFIRMQNYEFLNIDEEYIKFYYSVMYKMMESVSGLIMETIEKSGILTADDFKIIYGGYMDKADILYAKEG